MEQSDEPRSLRTHSILIHVKTTKMSAQNFPSLITPDAQAGLKLAAILASELGEQIQISAKATERPGGTNFLLPAGVPKEITAGILFFAIAAANQGWNGKL